MANATNDSANDTGDSGGERRSEHRLGESVTILLERYAADYDSARPATIVVCHGLDISANGLQLVIDRPIAVGTILRLCAQFGSGREPLYVIGEVKWLRPEADLHKIGLALYDSDDTDIVAWKELIARRLNP